MNTIKIEKAQTEWKDIKGYEGLYQISKGGAIKSFKRKGNWKNLIRKIKKHSSGYRSISLSKNGKEKGFLIHRLVAKAFISNPSNKAQVNHINGVKDDNRYTNLEWNTRKENNKHASGMGLFKKGKNHYKSFLTDKQIRIIKWALHFNAYQKELAKLFNITESTLTGIKKGKTWKHITI